MKYFINKVDDGISLFVLPLKKSGGPFIGPRGGKWKDAALTIPWKDSQQTLSGFQPIRNWVSHKPGLPKTTKEKYLDKEATVDPAHPVYKRERAALHESIINSFFKNSNGETIRPHPEGKKVAIVMMGGAASGKTTAVKKMLRVERGMSVEDKGFVNVNPDDVKERIPEYVEAKEFVINGKKTSARDAAFMAHEESSDLAHDIFSRAVDQGLNVVVDGTGRRIDQHIRKIKDLQSRGYEVQLMMTDVDIVGEDGALTRIERRAEEEGRYVPMGPPPPGIPYVAQDMHFTIPGNFEKAARVADSFALFNSRPYPPELKWQGKRGEPDVIIDEGFVRGFRNRGKELHEVFNAWKAERAINPEAPMPDLSKYMVKSMAPLKKASGGSTHDFLDPDNILEQIRDNVENTDLGELPKRPKKYPGAGKGGKGIVTPVWDWDPDLGLDFRIRYK